VLLIVGFQLVMGFNNFITIFYLFDGNTQAASTIMAHNGTIWAAVGTMGIFPMTWLSKRIGKRATVLVAFALIIGGNLAKIMCYSKAHPYLTVIPTICLSLGMVFAFSLVNAMIADVCDEDELASGMRREGIYFAVYNWWWKVAVSIAALLSGYLQHFTGFVEGAKTQSDATLFWLRAWEIAPPLLCLVGRAAGEIPDHRGAGLRNQGAAQGPKGRRDRPAPHSGRAFHFIHVLLQPSSLPGALVALLLSSSAPGAFAQSRILDDRETRRLAFSVDARRRWPPTAKTVARSSWISTWAPPTATRSRGRTSRSNCRRTTNSHSTCAPSRR
jgi:MFS family permease